MLDDALRVLDAAYRLDLPATQWLDGIVGAVHKSCGRGPLAELRGKQGVVAFEYAISDEGRVAVTRTSAKHASEKLVQIIAGVPLTLPPSYVRNTFGRHPCTLATHAGGKRERDFTTQQMSGYYSDFGWRDLFVINGLDASDRGIWIGLPLELREAVPPRIFSCWTRVAVHLAAALRLRRRLACNQSLDVAEAVVRPPGTIAHARGPASTKAARRALTDAVRALERLRAARGRLGAQALAGWKGLVEARWSLVDTFETDGRRYLVAQRNDLPLDVSCLTPREQQVLAFAMLGHTNKLVAYELGISPSTVAVLVHRAARKLRVSNRRELLDTFRSLANRNSETVLTKDRT